MTILPSWLSADPLAARLPHLDAEDLYDLAERAAILEFDCNLDRRTAELIATGGA